MKYIVVEVKRKVSTGVPGEPLVGETLELPVVFPEALVHSDMADGSQWAARHGIDKWESTKIVGAGFVTFSEAEAHCYGKSESLNIASRKKVDSDLITSLFFA